MSDPQPEDFTDGLREQIIDGKRVLVPQRIRMMPLNSAHQPAGYLDQDGEVLSYTPDQKKP